MQTSTTVFSIFKFLRQWLTAWTWSTDDDVNHTECVTDLKDGLGANLLRAPVVHQHQTETCRDVSERVTHRLASVTSLHPVITYRSLHPTHHLINFEVRNKTTLSLFFYATQKGTQFFILVIMQPWNVCSDAYASRWRFKSLVKKSVSHTNMLPVSTRFDIELIWKTVCALLSP